MESLPTIAIIGFSIYMMRRMGKSMGGMMKGGMPGMGSNKGHKVFEKETAPKVCLISLEYIKSF